MRDNASPRIKYPGPHVMQDGILYLMGCYFRISIASPYAPKRYFSFTAVS